MLVFKVVEVWQAFLSEYVDKKFTYICYRRLIRPRHEWIYYGSKKLCNLQQLKNRRFHVPQPTFVFPLETPMRLSRNMLHGWKDNSMLAKPLAAMRKSKNRYFYHILVSPGDAPGAITLNVVWMEREFDAYKLSRSMYPSIFNSFPVIRTASAKNRHFHVPPPTFLFPLETPLRLSCNMLHGWKDNSMLAKRLAACTYLHCVSKKVHP